MRLFTLVLLVAFLVTGTPVSAATKTKTPVVESDPVKAATVNLYCRLKAGKTIYTPSGSGVFISSRGVILTNAHVAEYFLLAGEKGRVTGWCSVRVGSPAEETYTADILYIPPTWLSENVKQISEKRPKGTGANDFALLYVTGAKKGTLPTTFPALPINTAATFLEGQKETVAGYPVGSLDFSDVRNKLMVTVGPATVTNTQSFGTGTQDLVTLSDFSEATFGVSGGPVLDSARTVTGLVDAKSSDKLRALTLPYINRALQAQTGFSLPLLLAGDLPSRAALTRLLLPSNIVSDLANGLRNKK